MNKDCAIARDLMPSVIDGVASGESRAFVEAHVAACAECAQVYADMKSEIQAVETGKDTAAAISFQTAMAQLRKTMGWRRIKTAALAVLLTLALLIAGKGIQYYLYDYSNGRIMPMDAYQISVYQGSGGTAYGTTHFLKFYAANGPMIAVEDDGEILYIYWKTTIIQKELERIPYPNPQYGVHMILTADGNLSLDGSTVIREIRQGTEDHYVTVYRAGDDIPAVDPVVDTYFQNQETYFQHLTAPANEPSEPAGDPENGENAGQP
jgi:hypothetical protein